MNMPYSSKEKQREYQCQWIADRRKTYLSDKTCVECGSTQRLEMHHIDAGKKITHRVWSWSVSRRDLEISKCAVLCRGCHRRHMKEYYVTRLQPTTKLSPAQARHMRNLRKRGAKYADLCRMFGVAKSTVSAVINRRLYRSVT